MNIASAPSKQKDHRNKTKKEIVNILSQLAFHSNAQSIRRGTAKAINDDELTNTNSSVQTFPVDQKTKKTSDNRKKESTVQSDGTTGLQLSMQNSIVNDVEITKISEQEFGRSSSDIRAESIVRNNIANADILSDLIDFEDRVKTSHALNELMKLSASVPSGLDLNCISLDQNDLSTIICHTLISNEHLIGLKE